MDRSGAILDKVAYDAIDGYNETLVSGEDWDLSKDLKRFSRIGEVIRHNESHVSLWKTLKKKYYYARHAKA